MFLGHVVEVPAEFLPLDNSQCCVQRVEFRDLYVLGILVDCFAIGERYALGDVVSFGSSSRGNRDDSSERIVFPELDSHPNVDERRTPLDQSLYNHSFSDSLIDANEDEAHLLQLIDREILNEVVVGNNSFPHAGIHAGTAVRLKVEQNELVAGVW